MHKIYVYVILLPLLIASCTTATSEPPLDGDQASRHLRVLFTEQPANHAIVSWTTLAPVQQARVWYDTVSHSGDLAGYAFQAPVEKSGMVTMKEMDETEGVPPGWYHHAQLHDLEPATRYFVIVESGGHVSDERHFITGPDDSRPFRLLSGGDSRLGGEQPRYAGRTPHVDRQEVNRLMASLLEEYPEIIALAHGADWGTTADWRHLYWWLEDHELTTTSEGRLLPLIAARGNHDRQIGFEENFWLGALSEENPEGYYYTSRLGNYAALLTLNTEISMAGDQREWLDEELGLQRPAMRWLLAQFHRPAYPAVKDFDGTASSSVRLNWSTLFEAHNLDLVLESDGHVLKRTVPIRNNAFAEDGVVYIGEGGLGVPQREPDQERWFLQEPGFSMSAHHVWMLDISPERLGMEAIGLGHEVLDEHALEPRMVEMAGAASP